MDMNVLKLTPSFKDYIWGGTRLRDEWGKECDLDRVAESWEVSCHKNGSSYLTDTGETLADYLISHPEAMGTRHRGKEFPILVKLIDAYDNLSVQVHPNDKAARELEGAQGKTEVWYVVDALPGAKLIFGLDRDVTRAELAERIKDGSLSDVLNEVEVHPGDVFFIPAGTLHGIGKGCLIAEIQQNSDITYRVFDYNRLGADGKPRELHIDKAVHVASLTPTEQQTWEPGVVARCPYFTVYQKSLTGEDALPLKKETFQAILVLDGEGSIGGKAAKKGDAFFLPAGEGSVSLSGNLTYLLTEC